MLRTKLNNTSSDLISKQFLNIFMKASDIHQRS